ncbi:MAG TPA: GerMN domain-containing protein [Roseiflexaceae bacterium]|nr:GerMN domain-containing protein [Roseiflexaceae bacterium]
MRATMQRLLVLALALAALGLVPSGTRAQSPSQFFPETGHTVGGRFLEYWRQHGGLAVFGYPLTEQMQEGGRSVQYFERQRFELAPENRPPYDVLLGRMGDEILRLRGIDWQSLPVASGPTAGCRFFALTRHNVCDQATGAGFLSYWSNHGLEFDGRPGKSEAESLALFGYPLTEPQIVSDGKGGGYEVQWFERARFEWHPGNPQPYRVLLGRLGAELLEGRGPRPTPEPGTVSRVKVFLIALEDDGRSGPRIGCNDSVVGVEVAVEPTRTPLAAALNALLAIRTQFYGESGLYNALYQSDLRVERVAIEGGRATIALVGSTRLGGVCDNPRVEAQIKETARQFPSVTEVEVFLNGQRLEDVLSGR